MDLGHGGLGVKGSGGSPCKSGMCSLERAQGLDLPIKIAGSLTSSSRVHMTDSSRLPASTPAGAHARAWGHNSLRRLSRRKREYPIDLSTRALQAISARASHDLQARERKNSEQPCMEQSVLCDKGLGFRVWSLGFRVIRGHARNGGFNTGCIL